MTSCAGRIINDLKKKPNLNIKKAIVLGFFWNLGYLSYLMLSL